MANFLKMVKIGMVLLLENIEAATGSGLNVMIKNILSFLICLKSIYNMMFKLEKQINKKD